MQSVLLFFDFVVLCCCCCLKVYKKAIKNLLPTPAKSHYTFNLRDFSRVIHGCLLIKKSAVENKHVMIRLFVHEVFRVFYDRLVEDDDRAWLFNLVKDIVKEHFREAFDKVFAHLKEGSSPVSIMFNLLQNNCPYCKFRTRKLIIGEISIQMCMKV